MERPKTIEELDTDICDYCPLPDEAKGVHNYGNGPVMCEGRYCPEAYDNYLEEFEFERVEGSNDR